MVMVLGLLALTLGACAQTTQTPTSALSGNLKVYVTDAPPQKQVTSIMVTVSEVKVHLAVPVQSQQPEETASDNQTSSDNITSSDNQSSQEEQNSEGKWITIELSDNATTFDLLKIQGIEQFLGASNITAGKYTQVRLVIEKIQVALGDGELKDARVPSNELKIVSPFEVIAGETTALVLDFEADKMVTVTGNDEIIVKPVVKLTVKYEKASAK
jgi:cytoskeletal protein RodZ